MDDSEIKLRREVQELKTEVRRLKRLVEGGITVIGLGLIIFFPQLFWLGILIGVLILFALLVSPVRHLIFPSIFHKRD